MPVIKNSCLLVRMIRLSYQKYLILYRCISNFSENKVEHYPISVKLEDVPCVEIAGLSCSEEGILFLADKGRSLVYRLDLSDGTCFSFVKDKISKSLIVTHHC